MGSGGGVRHCSRLISLPPRPSNASTSTLGICAMPSSPPAPPPGRSLAVVDHQAPPSARGGLHPPQLVLNLGSAAPANSLGPIVDQRWWARSCQGLRHPVTGQVGGADLAIVAERPRHQAGGLQAPTRTTQSKPSRTADPPACPVLQSISCKAGAAPGRRQRRDHQMARHPARHVHPQLP